MFLASASLLLLSIWLIRRLYMIGRREPSLPPGPPTIPLLGNLNIFPTEYAHYKFTDWAKEYGDIYSLKIGPGTVVVITSMEAVRELMEKRSGSTADRPPNYMADNITGGLNMVLARYGSKWRILRKTAHAILTPHAVTAHLPIQIAESTQVMYDLLKAPELFYTHIRRYSNSVVMSLLYGKRSPRYETREATLFFESQHLWELALEPGAHPPVDVLPFLRYVPRRWAPWKALCDKTREAQRKLYFGLLDECMERVQRGKENGCYMEEVIKHQDEFGLDRELSGYLGGVMIEGGSDTTSSFLQSLILLLTAFPNVQRKAHKEMDRVVGDQRVPTLDDVPHLPYIQAIIKETHRMRPVAPLAVPHLNREAETYRGYVIPEGSTIFVNTWGIFHDPDIYDDPKIFNPDRYMHNEHGTKPNTDTRSFRTDMGFGSGRRICPGIHLANNSLLLNTMNLVWAFTFDYATDPSSGQPIPVDLFDYHKGILTAPKPFRCKISCRSSGHAQIIEREFREAIPTFERFEANLSVEDEMWLKATRN
ncbi:cytochrome P450 [Lentinula edodes]|uniref:Cytochrome P450 n=1 Tax=Lentinula lateritia TaxID=40482 RepID=A0A9W9DZP8_9AGAR|nr:cytochrome P450 [Lentinula edodes]KAJ3893148.1 cytochrome P450 [Lentinula edodes]KAJ4493532.1 cytochrome P450 [Lentinula edodes]